MGTKTRIDSIATDISLIVDQSLSPAAQQMAVANYATDQIKQADTKNQRVLGRVPPKTITVDGRRGASLEQVRAVGGSIIVEWELMTDVLVWIGNTLRDRSPVVSGAYRDSHTLYADGVEIEVGAEIPGGVSELVFLSPLPYARKLEIGKTESGRDFVVQVPNRIYERTAEDANSRFGNIAKISMTYRAPFGGYLLKYVSAGAGRRAAAAHERELRVPAIVVSLKAA
jgi:hypothetical protein